MVSRAESWHVPYMSKHNAQDPNDCLNVIFLQRVSDEEYLQITESLVEVDEDWLSALDVPRPRSRTLVARKWIRDYWPSSDVILEIAKHAYSNDGRQEKSYQSLIFVDPGWEAGNVIAARWEGEGDATRLKAVRVRMNIAKSLLSACDFNESYTMAKVLGDEAFEDAEVNFYVDANPPSKDEPASAAEEYKIPKFLPQDVVLSKTEVVIISLKHLSQTEIEELIRAIVNGHDGEDPAPPVKIHNWHGSYTNRTEIRKLYYRIQQNSSESDRAMPLFLVDALLEGPDGTPQLISASDSTDWRQKTVKIMPVKTESLLKLWKNATQGTLEECFEETEELVDIWNAEYVFDLDVHKNFREFRGAPIFYLQPFNIEEERVVRTKLRELNDIEEDEDWGKDWIYFGYIFDDGQRHTIEDLRDLFESCDPLSLTFDSKKPGPYRLLDYPSNFIAVDGQIFEPESRVWLASSLDFYLDDYFGDQLGWFYGLIDAKEAHLAWVNLDIANMGPEEHLDESFQLWLSDVKEARREWEERRAEDFA